MPIPVFDLFPSMTSMIESNIKFRFAHVVRIAVLGLLAHRGSSLSLPKSRLSSSGRYTTTTALFQSSSALDVGGVGGIVVPSNSLNSIISSNSVSAWTPSTITAPDLPFLYYHPQQKDHHHYRDRRSRRGDTAVTLSVSTTADLTPITFGCPPDALSHILGNDSLLQQTAQALSHRSMSSANTDTDNDTAKAQPELPVSTVVLPLYQLALSGSVTTALADMLVHPMDCIKTLQQQEPSLSLLQAAHQLYATCGVAGFYHGFFTYAGTDAVSGAIKFAVWELWKRRVVVVPIQDNNDCTQPPQSQKQQEVLGLLVGAALAFAASSVTLVPGEVLKQALQMGHYANLQDAVQGIYQQSGWPGFYTGYQAVLCRDVPYTMLELTLYELFKRVATTSTTTTTTISTTATSAITEEANSNSETPISTASASSSSSTIKEIVVAIVTGALAATLTNPSDVVKTQLVMHAADSTTLALSFGDCFMDILTEHGPAALWAGAAARVAWIVPFTAAYLPVYDALQRFLSARHIRHMQAQQQQSPQQQQHQQAGMDHLLEQQLLKAE